MRISQAQKFTYCFWSIALAHVFVWTFLPNFFRSSLPIDALEGFVWGSQLEWGYDRNPWLNGWLTRFAIEIGGHYGWMTYLFSQLCVFLAFWSVWQLGKKIISPFAALMAVGMLEAIQYYNLAAVDFNDNVLELGLWPLLAYFFYRAITSQNLSFWLAVGLIAGLALMAKYYTVIFLFSLFLFLIYEPKARQSFKQRNFYLGCLVFLFIISPHILWLFHHHFATIQYALNRVNDNVRANIWNYIQPGTTFAFMQLLNFLGAVFLFALSLIPSQKMIIQSAEQSFNCKFLWIVGFGTYSLTILLAFMTGWQLHVLWGMPLLSLWGLILLNHFQPKVSVRKLFLFLSLFFIVFVGYVVAYCIPMFEIDNNSSSNFPAKAISTRINQLWQQEFHTPLHYIAGDRYLAGYISLYMPFHPMIYIDWDNNKSPWIDEVKLRQEGAVFIQYTYNGNEFSQEILKRFPRLKVLPVIHFLRPRAYETTEPVDVVVGVLPPEAPFCNHSFSHRS